ncbi:MAG: hypothetical protein E8D44_13210 [Nitrospira sp.]|nr:MAG: hypothetical protein E8D44_13210 [Nitrospira sp.]
METPKLDELLQRCCLTNELRVNAMLGTHGPALVAALKEAITLADNERYPRTSDRWKALLAELEAACQK